MRFVKELANYIKNMTLTLMSTIVHPWCVSHFTSISTYGVWGVRVEIQVSKRELHMHIHFHLGVHKEMEWRNE